MSFRLSKAWPLPSSIICHLIALHAKCVTMNVGVRRQQGRVAGGQPHHSHPWRLLAPRPDLFLFVQQDTLRRSEFEQWPLLTDVMPVNGAGYITARDNLVVDFDRDAVIDRIQRFNTSRLDDRALLAAFEVSEKKGWDIARARRELKHGG